MGQESSGGYGSSNFGSNGSSSEEAKNEAEEAKSRSEEAKRESEESNQEAEESKDQSEEVQKKTKEAEQCEQFGVGGEIVGWGRKPQDLSDAEAAAAAFQGIHARFVLVVIDEAAGVEPWLWDAVDSLATNEQARVLALGNPTDPTSRFAEVCQPSSGWNPKGMESRKGMESPATGGPVRREPPRISRSGREGIVHRFKTALGVIAGGRLVGAPGKGRTRPT
jgi:hypothetical protein